MPHLTYPVYRVSSKNLNSSTSNNDLYNAVVSDTGCRQKYLVSMFVVHSILSYSLLVLISITKCNKIYVFSSTLVVIVCSTPEFKNSSEDIAFF